MVAIPDDDTLIGVFHNITSTMLSLDSESCSAIQTALQPNLIPPTLVLKVRLKVLFSKTQGYNSPNANVGRKQFRYTF